MTRLIAATDAHFAWLLGEGPAPDGLLAAKGGVESPEILAWLRRVAAELAAAGVVGSWLIVASNEVVGLCGLKAPPDGFGAAEIGYGVAATRRGEGHATRAVRHLVSRARDIGGLSVLRAETTVDNSASRRVLERNGFTRVASRAEPEDGELIVWSLMLR